MPAQAITAVIALVFTAINVAITGWNVVYAQNRSDRRETSKWTGDQLLKLTSELLRLSTERQSALDGWAEAYENHARTPDRLTNSAANVYSMELLVEQARLLNDYVAQKAEAIYALHKAAEDRYSAGDFDHDPLEEVWTLMVDSKELAKLHRALILGFRIQAHVGS